MSCHVPSFMEFGPARVISPDGSHQVPAALWAGFAALVLLEAVPDLLADWVQDLEQQLGVGEMHRVAVEKGVDAARAEMREAKRRRLLERSEQASRQKVRDPLMVAKIDQKAGELADAVTALPEGDSKHARRARKAGDAKVRKLREELDQLRAEELAQEQLYGAAAEPIFLARQRGEEVEAFEAETADFARDEHGAMTRHKRGTKRGMPVLVYDRTLRAKKLEGIEHAFANGYLDGGRAAAHPQQLLATGQLYADACGALNPLGAANLAGAGGGGGSGEAKGPQVKAVEAGEMLDRMREGLSPRERRVLDLVCGQGMRLRQVADLMAAGFPASERALRSGLRMAGENWRVAQERRRAEGEPSAAESVRIAHRLISRMRT